MTAAKDSFDEPLLFASPDAAAMHMTSCCGTQLRMVLTCLKYKQKKQDLQRLQDDLHTKRTIRLVKVHVLLALEL